MSHASTYQRRRISAELTALRRERDELRRALATGWYGRIQAVELREPPPVTTERTLRVVRGAA